MSSSSFSIPRFLGTKSYVELEKEDSESSETPFIPPLPKTERSFRRRFLLSAACNIFLTVLLTTSLLLHTPGRWKDKAIIRASSTFSPILNKVPLALVSKTINGSFMDEAEVPDMFRALPSEEVDQAWLKIAHPTWITIDESEARSLGRNISELVRAPEAWGRGSNQFLAMMDFNHQLHCVDQLRRAAFRDEYPVAKDERWDFQKEHWMHCVHILYQNVMCTGSTELITYNWRETQRFPVPDFIVEKKCKNSEALLDYQEKIKLSNPNKLRDEMVKPADAVTLPLPPHLKAFLDAHD